MTSLLEWWNHYRYGEQNRERNMRLQGISYNRRNGPLTGPISTLPPLNDPNWKWGIDIAGIWDGVINALRFKQFGGSFCIVKAADGTITATRLYENAYALQLEAVPLALYFWLYPNSKVNCVNQGKKWAALARELGVKVGATDYEWTTYGGQAANPESSDLALAIDAYEQSLGEQGWIYTSLGYVMDHPVAERFKRNPWWAAQYGVLIPSSVYPWGTNWTCWQESDRWGPASQWGIDPAFAHVTDGDRMSPSTFYSFFSGTDPEPPPPTTDVITSPYPGVAVTSGRRFDSDFRMTAISPGSIRAEQITPPGSARIVEEVDGDLVFNGGDFDMTTYQAIGLLRSSGREYAPQADAEPAIAFDGRGGAWLDHHVQPGWTDALGLKRYIVIDGAVSPNTSVARSVSEDREVAWDEREPRTIFGLRPDGTRLILNVKGRQANSLGMTLYQAADVMIEFGAERAGDGDGGDSVQSRVGQEVFVGTLQRRLVADFYTITITGGGTMTQVIQGTVNPNQVVKCKIGPGGSYADSGIVLRAGAKIEADRNTNQWLHVTKVNGQAVNGEHWASSGVNQSYITWGWVDVPGPEPPPEPPPPAPDDDFFNVNLTFEVVNNKTGARYGGTATAKLPRTN